MTFVDGAVARAVAYSLPMTVRLGVISHRMCEGCAGSQQSAGQRDGAEDSGKGSVSDLHVLLLCSLNAYLHW